MREKYESLSATVLKDLESRVYRYNPSVGFIMIGTNDMLDNLSNEETISNVGKIVDGIKKNRPSAVINVISLFPVNTSNDSKVVHEMVRTRNNKDINIMNKGIKKMCKEKKVTYIDVNSLLLDKNNSLDINYTTDGSSYSNFADYNPTEIKVTGMAEGKKFKVYNVEGKIGEEYILKE